MFRSHRSAFTLIELLVVIAILAILFVVVLLVLNPAQLLMQARDSNRIQDLATLSDALGIYTEDAAANGTPSLGAASAVYVSIPDAAATSTAGDQCQGLSLLSLPAAYSYHCASPSNYRNINGTGWVPVSFSSVSIGSPISQLPVDPTDSSSSRLYYTYATNGSQYELTAVMESAKYSAGGSNDVVSGDGGPLATVYEKGTKLGLEPLDYGDPTLVGWWNFGEGSSSVAYDYSGNNATGSWNGTASGTNGYYSAGQGNFPWAGTFNGSNDYVNVPSRSNLMPSSASTVSAWVKASISFPGNAYFGFAAKYDNGGCTGGGTCGYDLGIDTYANHHGELNVRSGSNGNSSDADSPATADDGSWHFIVGVFTGSQVITYSDGVAGAPISWSYPTGIDSNSPFQIGDRNDASFFGGSIDDVRVYNRALSSAQIAAMYSGGK